MVVDAVRVDVMTGIHWELKCPKVIGVNSTRCNETQLIAYHIVERPEVVPQILESGC